MQGPPFKTGTSVKGPEAEVHFDTKGLGQETWRKKGKGRGIGQGGREENWEYKNP